jgi:hypothetical protein
VTQPYDVFKIAENARYEWVGSAGSLSQAVHIIEKKPLVSVTTFCVYSRETDLRTFYEATPGADARLLEQP